MFSNIPDTPSINHCRALHAAHAATLAQPLMKNGEPRITVPPLAGTSVLRGDEAQGRRNGAGSDRARHSSHEEGDEGRQQRGKEIANNVEPVKYQRGGNSSVSW